MSKKKNTSKKAKTKKQKTMVQRKAFVELWHAHGFSNKTIADEFKVNEKTIERDLDEIREKNLRLFRSSEDTQKWILDKLSSAMSAFHLLNKSLWVTISTSGNESVRVRASKQISENYLRQIEVIKSLGFLVSELGEINKNFTSLQKNVVEEKVSQLTPDELRKIQKIRVDQLKRSPDFEGKDDMLSRAELYYQQLYTLTITKRKNDAQYASYDRKVVIDPDGKVVEKTPEIH